MDSELIKYQIVLDYLPEKLDLDEQRMLLRYYINIIDKMLSGETSTEECQELEGFMSHLAEHCLALTASPGCTTLSGDMLRTPTRYTIPI